MNWSNIFINDISYYKHEENYSESITYDIPSFWLSRIETNTLPSKLIHNTPKKLQKGNLRLHSSLVIWKYPKPWKLNDNPQEMETINLCISPHRRSQTFVDFHYLSYMYDGYTSIVPWKKYRWFTFCPLNRTDKEYLQVFQK